jgi:hypothetical protein
MPISGLTSFTEESNPVYDLLGVADVKCYKGKRKTGTGEYTRPGADLQDKIRIATTHRSAIRTLKEAGNYGQPNEEGDFIVDQINLYLALEDPDLTFDCNMKPFDGSGPLLLCDRNTIYKEAKTITTHKGKRRTLVSCDKPCPLRGTDSWDCPNECKPDGVLHFYIRELLDSDLMVHCQFEMKAYGDVPNIIKQVRAIKKEFGSLTQSPYPCYWTRHKIPLVLSRVERSRNRPATKLKPEDQWKKPGKKEYEYTGKKGLAEFWDLDLQVDSVWMDWYRKRQLAEELISRGINPTKEVIVGLMTGDETIDVRAIASSTAVEAKALPPVVSEVVPESVTLIPTARKDRGATAAMLDQLESAFDENGWTENAIAQLLQHYQIADLGQISQEQRLELMMIANNQEAARQWNNQAHEPVVEVVIETISRADWDDIIYPEFAKHQWSNAAIMSLLQQEYGISRVGEILKSQITEMTQMAGNEEVRSQYIPG